MRWTGMKDTEFYEKLLGLESPWEVSEVRMDVVGNTVEVVVVCPARKWVSGEGEALHVHGYEERRWRHLDTCQMRTEIHARVPRVRYPGGRTEMVAVPWAAKGAGWTLMFEALAVRVLQACGTVDAGARLLGIGWHTADAIMRGAVERGLDRRDTAGVITLGVDEKSFRKAHRYASVLVDAGAGKVLEVVEGRTAEAAAELFGTLPPEVREAVAAVAMDMWKPYRDAALAALPNADIVHDRYHIAAHMGDAVDKVRRAEHRDLCAGGDAGLAGTRYDWLHGVENLRESRWESFQELLARPLKTARAWAIKEHLRNLWDAPDEAAGREFFKRWYGWAIRCRLEPVKRVAKMLKAHFHHIVTWFRHRLSNAAAEGLNSKIQALKSAARGFHSFASYRVRILFFCGGLDMAPANSRR